MKRPTRPWEAPGYRFSIGWPAGAGDAIQPAKVDASAISRKNREKRVAQGDTGTMVGLTRKGPKEGQPDKARLLPTRGRA